MIQAALQYHFYGIGPNVAARLCAKLSIHPKARLASLSHPTVTALAFEMAKMRLDNDLKNDLRDNLERLRALGTYRGRRHAQVRNLYLFSFSRFSLLGSCVGIDVHEGENIINADLIHRVCR